MTNASPYRPRRAGEWCIPDHALDASRAPPPPVGPVVPTDVHAGDLAGLLEVPGPILVLDGEEARLAWESLRADFSIRTGYATGTAMVVNSLRDKPVPEKLLLIECVERGLQPETLLMGNDMSRMRVGILAAPTTQLSEAAAAKCRILRVVPSPDMAS